MHCKYICEGRSQVFIFIHDHAFRSVTYVCVYICFRLFTRVDEGCVPVFNCMYNST